MSTMNDDEVYSTLRLDPLVFLEVNLTGLKPTKALVRASLITSVVPSAEGCVINCTNGGVLFCSDHIDVITQFFNVYDTIKQSGVYVATSTTKESEDA